MTTATTAPSVEPAFENVAATGVDLKRLVRRRGRVLYAGRWVTQRWYRTHVEDVRRRERMAAKKEPRDFFDPDRIAFVRDIMRTLNEVSNEVYRAHVVRMLDELHRIKKAERDAIGSADVVSSPNTKLDDA